MGWRRLLYFVKSKSGTKCKNFNLLFYCVFMSIATVILLYFLIWLEGGGLQPP